MLGVKNEKIDKDAIIKLIKFMGDVNQKDKNKDTALHHLMRNKGDKDLLEELKAKGLIVMRKIMINKPL